MADNLRLFNVLTRHQIYLEGVKAGQSREFNDVLVELDKVLRSLFLRLNYNTLDALTKKELREFLRDLKSAQGRVYSGYAARLEKQIREFMAVDVDLTKEIFETLESRSMQQAYDEGDGFPIWGLAAFLGTSKADEQLWSTIKNSPIPANGALMLAFISQFTASASQAVENMIRKAYANKWTKQETINAIIGTKAKNWRDGEFAKINRQAGAVIATAIQHVSSIVQAGIASIFYRRYVWVSVIDGGTTDICLGRDGKTYEYGKGPLPPAHIRCRSKTIPKPADVDDAPQSYYSWLKSQPSTVQDDILGRDRASGLRNGNLTSKDFPKFVDAKPLSVDEFSKKRGVILTDD